MPDDYIKRRDAINAACSDCYCCETIDEFEDTTCPEKQKFMSIPAAAVAPVIHARWVFNKDGQLCCTNCETVPINKISYGALIAYEIKNIKGYMLYCPNCGAKMDKEEGSES